MNQNSELILQLQQIVASQLDLTHDITDAEIRAVIDRVVADYGKERYLTVDEKALLRSGIFNAMRGLDVLQPLVDDPSITEIMINGPDHIFVERDGKVMRENVSFGSSEKLENVIQSIVARVNRTVNESTPIVDARLTDGSRVNVVLPPIALNGPTVTIRKFPENPFTMEQLVQIGSITPEVKELLHRMVRARYNIFISGGTGSGKTTFLNALSNFIPHTERVITIEDSAELQIVGIDNLVRLETRNANMENKGAITIRDLIKSSLRMRPERIVVGEVRGGEALDMLQAMNTGHDGSLSTGHANSTQDMLSRLETMVLTGAEIPLAAIRQQIASAVDIIIHLSRLRDHSRRTMEITEVVEFKTSSEDPNGKIILNPLYRFEEEGEDKNGHVIGKLVRTSNKMVHTEKFRAAGESDQI